MKTFGTTKQIFKPSVRWHIGWEKCRRQKGMTVWHSYSIKILRWWNNLLHRKWDELKTGGDVYGTNLGSISHGHHILLRDEEAYDQRGQILRCRTVFALLSRMYNTSNCNPHYNKHTSSYIFMPLPLTVYTVQ